MRRIAAGSMTLVHDFSRICARSPSRLAIADDKEQVTYREAHRRASCIATALVRAGVRPSDSVLVAADRTADNVCGIIGAALCGGVYVPVDPAEPEARISQVVIGSRARVAVADETGAAALSRHGVDVILTRCAKDIGNLDFKPRVTESDMAYILFTSGSTGTPNGVAVTWQSLDQFMHGVRQWVKPSPDDRWGAFHAFTFDVSLFELWTPLVTGASIVLLPRQAQLDPEYLSAKLASARTTRLCQTPTALRQLTRLGSLSRDTHALYIAGEKLDFQLLAPLYSNIRRGSLEAWNVYGPTETTIYATAKRIHPDDILHEKRSVIGSALPHVDVTVRTEDGAEAERGGLGEICISGPGVALGYVNSDTLTAERFVRLPDGRRTFRTRDIGRLAGDEIEYVGRNGGFIKVRGYRIEPGDVVAALCSHPDVLDAAVIVSGDNEASETLVAGLVLRNGAAAPGRDFRTFVASRLPAYMRPTRIVAVRSLPRLASSKLDIAATRRIILDAARMEPR